MAGTSATGARLRARKQPAEVRRETLLDAAMRVFARTPYHSAGTAAIAQAAGVAEPTIYRHFGSKRELYLAALERTCSYVTEAWERISATAPDALATMGGLGEWYQQSVMANPDPIRLRMRAVAEAEDDEVRLLLQEGYGRVRRLVADVVRRGQAEGVFRADADPEAAAGLFMGIGQMLDLALLTGQDPEADCERLGQVFNRCLLAP